jgi:xanthine dehydrogenase YagS FAD-binding subunit
VRPFEYASAKTKAQAVGLLGTSFDQAEVLAGGSDLLALMKDDVVHPKRLVSIQGIPELREIRPSESGLSIGALRTLDELAHDPEVGRRYPALAQALEEAASPQIRNVATLGGNLCQRPRCWYFRGGHGLLAKKPGGESLVLKGDNRYHAILGNQGPAYFVSPSTIAPVLAAYGAKVRIHGPKGDREATVEKFFRVPQSDAEREHDLAPNEIVTEILIPSAKGTVGANYEVRQKEAFDWPFATACAVLRMSGGRVESARIVLGHVAPVPWVSEMAARAITGKSVTAETAAAAGQAAVESAIPLSRNKYKVQLARVAVARALLEAAKATAAA